MKKIFLAMLCLTANAMAAQNNIQAGPQKQQFPNGKDVIADPSAVTTSAAPDVPVIISTDNLPPPPVISVSDEDADKQDQAPMGYQKDGSLLVPTNQMLTPAGLSITVSGRPVDLALSPDGKTLAVLNMGELNLIDLKAGKLAQTLGFPSENADCSNDARSGSYGGMLYLPDGSLYYSTVQGLGLLKKGAKTLVPMKIPCGMALSNDGKRLYVAINGKNQLGIVDLKSGELTDVMNVGVAPFGVAVGASGKIYVSNWGGERAEGETNTAISMDTVVRVDANGLPLSGTVSVIDDVKNTIKSIPVGILPGHMIFSPDKKRLYVANANSDSVSVIDPDKDTVIETLSLRPDKDLPFGSSPNALALSPDGSILYAANGTNNAVAVLPLKGADAGKISGLIPTAWYPSAVLLDSKAGAIYVANTKGFGALAGPAGKRQIDQRLGTVSIIPMPDQAKLAEYTASVHRNNRLMKSKHELLAPRVDAKAVPLPERHGEPSLIKHVLYIIKENKTYDGVFGDLPEGDGDASLCMFCGNATPNQHALAKEFVLLDHFYSSGSLSADGHQWTTEAYASSYIERAFGGFPRSYPSSGEDPLVLSPTGFLWSSAMAKGLSFRDYGEFMTENPSFLPEKAGWKDMYDDYLHGTHNVTIVAKANIAAMQPYMCPGYCAWPVTIPDVYKANLFIKELKEFEKKGEWPSFIIMSLPNDHTGGTGPGFPTPRAQVADNDYALGQIVEAVSKSIFWKDTAIFVVEDDPQGMPDHLDGHRTTAFMISPYTKRHSVDKTNYNHTGMVKTIELVLGLPAMNQLDLSATPMRACFTDTPDLTPYTLRPNEVPLDSMNLSLEELGPKERYWAEQSMKIPMIERPGLDSEKDDKMLSHILWHATRGYDTPYPKNAADNDKDDE